MMDYNSMHAAVLALRQKQIFFVGGSPKSGTTWLQLLLDAHPLVSCSGEGYFPTHLWNFISQAFQLYNEGIKFNNKELFNEIGGYKGLDQDDVSYIFATCIAVALRKQSKHKTAIAIGDKTPANIRALDGLAALFPNAKFIQIVRDGRDCAISGWFHNQRNAEWVALNRGSLTEYLASFCDLWVLDLEHGQKFSQAHPDRIRQIRYEDLVTNSEAILSRLFEFLGVNANPNILAHCREQASFAKQSGGRNPGDENRESFFRKGVAGDWRNHMSDEQNLLFREKAGQWLQRFGYD